jgi:hypothetical protein
MVSKVVRELARREKGVWVLPVPARTATAAGGYKAWLRNDYTGYDIHIDAVIVNWSGGSPNHNRRLHVKLNKGSGVPSANQTTATPVNTHGRSADDTTSIATAYYWDEVGNGMTVSGDGTLMHEAIVGQGPTVIITPETYPLILGTDQVLGITDNPEEGGEVAYTIIWHYEAKGQDDNAS